MDKLFSTMFSMNTNKVSLPVVLYIQIKKAQEKIIKFDFSKPNRKQLTYLTAIMLLNLKNKSANYFPEILSETKLSDKNY